jgi:hypothetical protein
MSLHGDAPMSRELEPADLGHAPHEFFDREALDAGGGSLERAKGQGVVLGDLERESAAARRWTGHGTEASEARTRARDQSAARSSQSERGSVDTKGATRRPVGPPTSVQRVG